MAKTRVTKAVIPAAGLGTRFLPATKAQPKEMLPIVDKPAIQYVVEEAVRSGIDDILIITGRGKRTLEDHFDRNFELEYYLADRGKHEDLEGVRDLAELILEKQVRLGRPRMIRGLPDSMSGPAFSTGVGLLRYGLREHVVKPDHAAMMAAKNKRSFGRIGHWLRENF